jgi:hypothetical protein
MKPSEKCKVMGLKSLNHLGDITGESVQTLINWNKNKPKLFYVVLMGATSMIPTVKSNEKSIYTLIKGRE